jgi:aminoglycoside phosphotransferase (APT) family kinase protein
MIDKVRKGEELDEISLKKFLLENKLINTIKNELHASQYSNGFSNLTYLLKIENKEFVLRKPPKGAIKYGHDMGREFKVLTGLNKGFKKAPIAYVFSNDNSIIGSSFYIMEKVDGIILSRNEANSRKISPKEYSKIAQNWLKTFVELHELDFNKIGLSDLGKSEGYVERQIRNWSKQYINAATEEIPESGKIMNWLEKNQPSKYSYSLIHNDYKYDNIVFKNDSWNDINAVLDWEMCTLGDPLMDFGTALAYWTMQSDHPMILNGLNYPTSKPGNPGRMELVDMYGEKSGRKMNNLVFYYVYGLFKIAVIVQQIYYRFDKGLTKDEKFKNLNKMTRLLCTIAWQSVQKNKIENLF